MAVSTHRLTLPLRRVAAILTFAATTSVAAPSLLTRSPLLAAEPRCVDESLGIELVLAEPDLMTPIGCRFDARGRLYVIESHTHFPPDGYQGPPHDRIKIVDDSDGDGKLDRVRLFHEGTKKTMSLAITPDGWVYLATRASILRVRDSDGDDVADQTETLVSLETTADYPHNGLSGLWLDGPADQPHTLIFGMGENFGADYRLVASDGTTQVGSGEGGNIFRCDLVGGKLARIATGFWNPFGICRDAAGRLLMVDNDADAMPPCRICEVVEGGDYGFQFRFGRAGTHPLQAWRGELPATLPIVAGTGEAPCAILPIGDEYWVTSWGDNRIECYRPRESGASVVADQRIAVVGDAMFRPVDMALAPDGSLYVTDWVDRSYNVHRTGRLWRITFKTPPATTSSSLAHQRSDEERAAHNVAARDLDARIAALETTDPFAWQLAVAEEPSFLDSDGLALASPRARLAWLAALRWRDLADPASALSADGRAEILARALRDESELVRLAAVRWTAERRIESLSGALDEQLERETVSPQMLAAVVAAISYVEMGEVEPGGFDALTRERLVALAASSDRSPTLRAAALRLVPPEAPQWKPELLESLARHTDVALAREATRHLVVAASSNAAMRKVTESLANDPALNVDQRQDLQSILATTSASAPIDLASHPGADDIDGWMKQVASGGDADAGWRVFFGAGGAKCSSCHAFAGRGASVGPDLSTLAKTTTRKRTLESILHPSREIGPMYVPWKIVTTDGRALTGLKLNGGGVGNRSRYLAADATTFEVDLSEIEFQDASDQSIMPAGLEKLITVEQMRDLLAFLESES